MQKGKTKTNVLGIIAKAIGWLFSPIVLAILLALGFLSWFIDLLSKKSDEEFLSDKEVRKREIDRTNKRRHSFLDLIANYFKMLLN